MAEENAVVKTEEKKLVSIEELLDGDAVKSLGRNLCLTNTQIAKANSAVLKLINDEKLKDATTMSKIRFAYSVATLNYASDKAVVPVAYGKSIQAQVQYQGLLEDLKACGGVKELGWNKLYKGIDYLQHINSADCVELTIPDIKLDDPFTKLEVIGYYAYAKCENGKTYTCVMSLREIEDWASKYSISYKAFKKGTAKSSIWNDHKDDMSIKTVIRRVATQVLKIYPFDRLQNSLNIDQAVFDEEKMSYADNPQNESNKVVSDTIVNVKDAVATE